MIFRPVDKKELFNLRHASAWNVIERIFGIVKRRFRILLISTEYKIEIQARIPAALCALHNYIRAHDPHEGPLPDTAVVNDNPAHQGLGHAGDLDIAGPSHAVEGASAFRDRIATQMWEDYQSVLHERDLSDIDQFLGINEDEQYVDHEDEDGNV
jgi:hypothetical protein